MLVIGNWKMNGFRRDGIDRARSLAQLMLRDSLYCKVLICPPSQLLGEIHNTLSDSKIIMGGQDCHSKEQGSYTGDISAKMLKDIGCEYVIVGHSERRHNYGDSDEIVASKAKAAHEAELNAVICIGESKEVYQQGKTIEHLSNQLQNSIPETATMKNTHIAYEPCWAIGSGLTPTTIEIKNTHKAIIEISRKKLLGEENQISVLYGGSVDDNNAGSILEIDEVGGVLVGGASLIAEKFWSICTSANHYSNR
ncbi:MAG: triose-phosphate isomerase [Gammaproteobacteria bacterium]|nr:triose-phosphate isomerase [Gammaproteobacteria bacterium]